MVAPTTYHQKIPMAAASPPMDSPQLHTSTCDSKNKSFSFAAAYMMESCSQRHSSAAGQTSDTEDHKTW
jgi:hypothetical protein